MLAAVIWGLIQGLTEFLPVSSSGHLVIIPAFLSEMGIDVPVPSLAVSTVIHLGTLASVLIYYRREVMAVLQFRTNPEGRKLALLVGIGTIPALIGLPLADEIEGMQQSVAAVGWQLVATGVILVIGQRVATGVRRLMEGRIPDAVVVGVAQAIALVPGISRSGVTIAEIATRFRISEAHLMKVVHQLGRAGFIETVRGRSGGMRMADDVRVGDVVRRMERDLGAVECLRASGGDCLITPCCRLRGMLSKATAAFLAVLDDCTVADLVRDNEGLARLLGMRAA